MLEISRRKIGFGMVSIIISHNDLPFRRHSRAVCLFFRGV